MKKFWLLSIRFYQKFLSPDKSWVRAFGLGPACRYSPTCSEYTYQAINKYGSSVGWQMGLKRLTRCHPFAVGGLDPVR